MRAGACQNRYRNILAASEEMARSGKDSGKRGQLRIIGGRWRGRKFNFKPAPGLRPTTDRVRETLFNWLAPHVRDALCADLFAGSGALGLEALSRGARHCDFVDSSGAALAQIRSHLASVDAADGAHYHQLSALDFLQRPRTPYDIVFIDPPFGMELVGPTCRLLAEHRLLPKDALVYVESGTRENIPPMPPEWSLYREKSAGEVSYRLYIIDGEQGSQ